MKFESRCAVTVVVAIVLLFAAQPASAAPRPGQMSLGNSRNCFFSPMGCVFLPKMSRIRKLSADYQPMPVAEYER